MIANYLIFCEFFLFINYFMYKINIEFVMIVIYFEIEILLYFTLLYMIIMNNHY